MLKLNQTHAQAADNISSGIKESGKYIGVITRAEKLVSKDKGTQGIGISFRAENGQTADYLDIYHTKGDGETLSGIKTVNAILCCAKVAEAAEGPIKVEKYDKVAGARMLTTVTGYPALMGKRIGFLLQKTLETNTKTGADTERVQIFAVFNAETELCATEMYQKRTTPERLPAMLDALMARPVRDNRKKQTRSTGGDAGGRFDDAPMNYEDAPF